MNSKQVAAYVFQVLFTAFGLWVLVALLRLGRPVSFVFAVAIIIIVALPLSRYPRFTLRLRVFSVIALIVLMRVALGYQL